MATRPISRKRHWYLILVAGVIGIAATLLIVSPGDYASAAQKGILLGELGSSDSIFDAQGCKAMPGGQLRVDDPTAADTQLEVMMTPLRLSHGELGGLGSGVTYLDASCPMTPKSWRPGIGFRIY